MLTLEKLPVDMELLNESTLFRFASNLRIDGARVDRKVATALAGSYLRFEKYGRRNVDRHGNRLTPPRCADPDRAIWLSPAMGWIDREEYTGLGDMLQVKSYGKQTR